MKNRRQSSSFFARPTEGLLIVTSFNMGAGRGYFKYYDIALKEYVGERSFFNVGASDNVISFIGICEALNYRITTQKDLKVFCANSIAVGWAKKNKYNSRVADNKIRSIIEKARIVLAQNDFANEIKFWDHLWKSPKAFIDSELNPTQQEHDDLSWLVLD